MLRLRIPKTHLILSALFVCVFCWLCLSTPAPAAIVIDDFTTPQTQTGDVGGCATGDGILGGERDVTIYQGAEVHINAAYGNGCHIADTTGDNWGYAYFEYDGLDGSTANDDRDGLGHIDLTGGGQYNGFLVTFSQVDEAYSMSFFLDQEGYFGAFFLSIPIPDQPQSVFLPFADFELSVPAFLPTDPVPADPTISFSDIGFIGMSISLSPGGSCTIDSLKIIPEPSSLGFLIIGGLLLRKRVRSKFG